MSTTTYSRAARALSFALVSLLASLSAGQALAGQPEEVAAIAERAKRTHIDVNEIRKAAAEHRARWTPGETSMTLLSPEERAKRLGIAPPSMTAPSEMMMAASATAVLPTASLPSSIDWRNYNGKNYVTPVKNQGSCGSCWAFSTVGALESKALITAGADATLNLSEQIVLSCSGAGSCSGGYPDRASSFLVSTGTAGETAFPYSATNASCSSAATNWKTQAFKLADWHSVTTTLEGVKSALVQYGPLATTMNVYSDFYSYTKGVYHHVSGTLQGGHAVVLVGYDDADQAFIVKNSWGTGWGEAGYLRIAYTEMNTATTFATRGTLAYGNVINPSQPTCTFTLSKTSEAVAAAGATGTVDVAASSTAGCGWSASSSASWITITSGASGSGNGSVGYKVAANTGSASRSGTLTIAGKVFTVNQAGAGSSTPVCSLTASPSSIAAGGSSTLRASCNPAATSYIWSSNAGIASNSVGGTVSPKVSTTYTVAGQNAAGKGNTASATVTVTGGAVPPAPVPVPMPWIVQTTMPTFQWNASAGATSYHLVVKEYYGSQEKINMKLNAADLGCANGGTCSFKSDVALRKGYFHSWALQASNELGDSAVAQGNLFAVSGWAR